MRTTTVQRADRSIAGGLACIAAGVLLTVLTGGIGFVFLGAPMFLAAFVLGIVAMSRGRVLGGIFVLVFSLLAPAMLVAVAIGAFALMALS